MERGHESRGPVITPDTNNVGARVRAHQHDLFASFRNISYLKRFLLGAIEKSQRDEMQNTIHALLPRYKEPWCKSNTEYFSLSAFLVNLTQPHVYCGDVEWAIISPFGNFTGAEFCIADIERRFAFQEGHIAAIWGRILVHFTRKWVGSRLCLVSTMHSALMGQGAEKHDSEDSCSGNVCGATDPGKQQKMAKRRSARVAKLGARMCVNGSRIGSPRN